MRVNHLILIDTESRINQSSEANQMAPNVTDIRILVNQYSRNIINI